MNLTSLMKAIATLIKEFPIKCRYCPSSDLDLLIRDGKVSGTKCHSCKAMMEK